MVKFVKSFKVTDEDNDELLCIVMEFLDGETLK